uniref:C-type lectin domain-containing protein n=1 Tax=Caenorhabditis japonica TaxID=281687 RepID=A0A8R1EVN9_CAEJA
MIRLLACLCLFQWLSVMAADVNPCADSTWHYYNETGCCYKTSNDIGTWFEGSGKCAKLHAGAHMASLHSQNESKWVAKVYKNGIDGIHAWTGLSQTKIANNWTHTDGSEPWSWFHAPFLFLYNHTSCVEIVDNWLVELLQNSGKTQPTFCYHYLKSLCKYCPAPVVKSAVTTTVRPLTTKTSTTTTTTTTTLAPHTVKLEKAHPRDIVVVENITNATTVST